MTLYRPTIRGKVRFAAYRDIEGPHDSQGFAEGELSDIVARFFESLGEQVVYLGEHGIKLELTLAIDGIPEIII